MSLSPADLCVKLPKEFAELLEYSKNLEFEDKPDYEYIDSHLKEVMNEHEIENDGMYDWIKSLPKSILKKNQPEYQRVHLRTHNTTITEESSDDSSGYTETESGSGSESTSVVSSTQSSAPPKEIKISALSSNPLVKYDIKTRLSTGRKLPSTYDPKVPNKFKIFEELSEANSITSHLKPISTSLDNSKNQKRWVLK